MAYKPLCFFVCFFVGFFFYFCIFIISDVVDLKVKICGLWNWRNVSLHLGFKYQYPDFTKYHYHLPSCSEQKPGIILLDSFRQ